MGLAGLACFGRDGAHTVALCSCFRFQSLFFACECDYYLLSLGHWCRFHRMGACDSAAILRVRRIRAGAFTPASNKSMKPTPKDFASRLAPPRNKLTHSLPLLRPAACPSMSHHLIRLHSLKPHPLGSTHPCSLATQRLHFRGLHRNSLVAHTRSLLPSQLYLLCR